MRNLFLKGACLLIAFIFSTLISAQDLWDGTTATSFHAGNGTATNPYQIRTGAELMYFVGLVNAGDDFSGKTVKLMNDINMNKNNFCISQLFAGTFDGGSHVLTMTMGVSSNQQPFLNVSGRIHHLGFIISMENQYNGVYYGEISIIGTLKEGGIMEDCYYTVKLSNDIFYYQPALTYSNYGTICNCYAGGSFHIYGGYTRDGSLLVRDNYETGKIENCYAYVNNGITNNDQVLPLAYTNKGEISHNSTNVDLLNEWVDEHPSHSRWTATGTYKLVDFNPGDKCTVEFIDPLFNQSIPSVQVNTGAAIGNLPTPSGDCTFLGWKRLGQYVSATDVVSSNWLLTAQWEQRIRKQPTTTDMSVEVDDIAHASFRWYRSTSDFTDLGQWQSTNHSSESTSSKTINFNASVGDIINFSYKVSSEEYDYFSAYLNGVLVLEASGERTSEFSQEITQEGENVLLLKYVKDDDTSRGSDMVNVTDIKVTAPSIDLLYTSSSIPQSALTVGYYYFCKITYSNSGANLTSNYVQYIPYNPVSENYLTITDKEVCKGKSIVLPVNMSNTESVTALQFEAFLPDGVTISKCQLTDRKGDDHAASYRKLANGNYQVTVFSGSKAVFGGTEGAVLNLTLDVNKDMPAGEYPISLTNIELTTAATQAINPADVSATLTVSDVKIADVDGNGRVSITDAVAIVSHILGDDINGFVAAAADVDGNGRITITDAVAVVDMILSGTASAKMRVNVEDDVLDPQ